MTIFSLQETLIRSVRQAVKDEVNSAVQEQGATISSNVLDAMRSGAVTPVPTSPDPQQTRTHIMQLLRQGQLNAAFQQVFIWSVRESMLIAVYVSRHKYTSGKHIFSGFSNITTIGVSFIIHRHHHLLIGLFSLMGYQVHLA
jgi:hypothetical protein